MCTTCISLITTPSKTRHYFTVDPDISSNIYRHQEVKRLVSFEELHVNTPHTLSLLDSSGQRDTLRREALESIFTPSDGTGSRVAMEVIIRIPEVSEQMNGKARVFVRGGRIPANSQRSDKNSDRLCGRAAFQNRMILCRY